MVGKSTPELDYETVATCQRIYDFFLRFMGHLLSCTRGEALALDLRQMAINVSGIVVVVGGVVDQNPQTWVSQVTLK